MLSLSVSWRAIVVLAVAVPLAAACSRDSGRFGGPVSSPVSAAPTPRVMTEALPPPGQMHDQRPFDEQQGMEQDGPPQVAALPPVTERPTRENVLGQWRVASGGDSCQLNIALTSWEGGYRASTRGCYSPELTNVGAWNIEGDLVVLKDNEGNPVARLAKSGSSRFDGRLELGGSVSMSR